MGNSNRPIDVKEEGEGTYMGPTGRVSLARGGCRRESLQPVERDQFLVFTVLFLGNVFTVLIGLFA